MYSFFMNLNKMYASFLLMKKLEIFNEVNLQNTNIFIIDNNILEIKNDIAAPIIPNVGINIAAIPIWIVSGKIEIFGKRSGRPIPP